jgi:siroheme synthase
VSGHDEAVFTRLVGEVGPADVTLVVLMGRARRAALARILVRRGWAGETPAAVIVDASRDSQLVWRGTIADLAADVNTDEDPIESDGPATLVVGATAALALAAGEVPVEVTGARRADRRG